MRVKRLAGGPAHSAQVDDVHFVKQVDSLSRNLSLNCSSGTKFSSVTIEIWKTQMARTLSYTLKNVVISSYLYARSSGVPTESISLISESISHRYS
jgi:type VI protein secretion system component Hcp